jgi:pimeloyl-ACP methyl ester carboxylesterase
MRARGIEIAAKATGAADGPVLLWGHSLMGSMSQEEASDLMPWRGIDAHARLVRWDARGHGASETTLEVGDYRWSELAKDLWAIADEFEVKQAVVGGISMGAGTALHAAMQEPRRTLGLVLMAPPTAWDTRPRQCRLYRGMAKLTEFVGLHPFRLLSEISGRAARNAQLARLQHSVMRGLRTADPRAVRMALRGAARSDLPAPESLDALEVPTLILAWKDDWSHPLSTARVLAERLPDARLEVMGETSDLDEWPGLVREFIDSLRSGEPVAGPSRTRMARS